MSTVEKLRAMVERSAKASEGAIPGPWIRLHDRDAGSRCRCAQVWSTPADVMLAVCTGEEDEEQPLPTAIAQANARHIAAHSPSEMAQFRAVLKWAAKAYEALEEVAPRCRCGKPGVWYCDYGPGVMNACADHCEGKRSKAPEWKLLARLDAALSSQTIAE